jgi:hypothetical protein
MGKKFKEGWYTFECKKCDGEGKVESGKNNRLKTCKNCEGKGNKEVFVDACSECGGSRKVECDCTGGLGKDNADDDCYACGGKGKHMCPACEGRGFDIDCLIEAGVVIDEYWDEDE